MAIWSKGNDDTNVLIHQFTVGDDYQRDQALCLYDIVASIAHARMLGDTGIIPAENSQQLQDCLRALSREDIQLSPEDEDIHSRIEALLIERLGEAGKQLHTGRSRNDQVLCATRMWLKDELCSAARRIIAVIRAYCQQATNYEFHPLPGYTHQQRGMPSSVGMFFAAHARALLDDLLLLAAAYEVADSCPLGSGASYGVGLPLDREQTRSLLGFARGGYPAMADANSRGKVECAAVDALGAVMNDISRFAADMIFFTASECRFFIIDDGFTTGSSIMPQKKNLDLFELMRGRCARFLGLRTGLNACTIGLISGYSRDLQDTKGQVMDAVGLCLEALAVLEPAALALKPNTEAIIAALSPDLYATDEAYRLVMEDGMSFRDAYVEVGKHLDRLESPDHEAVVKQRSHAGSTGHLDIPALQSACEDAASAWQARNDINTAAWSALLNAEV